MPQHAIRQTCLISHETCRHVSHREDNNQPLIVISASDRAAITKLSVLSKVIASRAGAHAIIYTQGLHMHMGAAAPISECKLTRAMDATRGGERSGRVPAPRLNPVSNAAWHRAPLSLSRAMLLTSSARAASLRLLS